MATHSRRFALQELDADAERLPRDVTYETLVMVNVVYVGDPDADSKDWVLIDAGLPGFANRIARTAQQRFGDVRPKAIILTHGHFDHIGSLHALLALWPDVPVYAHRLELPYLTGRDKYPPPDPTVGGGVMPRASVLFPRISDFSGRIKPLPDDFSVPFLEGWRWVFTPGHSPGHVSLFRASDGTLIAGDAFITQKQESLIGVLTRKKVMHGPPTYFTPDWDAARVSLQTLSDLRPQTAITGHGLPMANPELDQELEALARAFDDRAIPPDGRYSKEPAVTDENGVVSVPPKPTDLFPVLAAAAGIAVVGVLISLLANRSQEAPKATSVHDWLKEELG